jgi:hypothetical protein
VKEIVGIVIEKEREVKTAGLRKRTRETEGIPTESPVRVRETATNGAKENAIKGTKRKP